MSQQISLKEAERKTFQATHNDGLWDVFLGCFFLIFVIAPYLSISLGDFWSSVVFLPFWSLVYLAIWLTRKHVITPRSGRVKFGPARKKKLARFSVVMLVVNIVSFVLGIFAVIFTGRVPGQIYSITIGFVLLIGLSLAAYSLDFPRLYIYGLLVGISPLVGEWLWTKGLVSHHGFPITFGISAGIMILTGLVTFACFLRNNPVLQEATPEKKP